MNGLQLVFRYKQYAYFVCPCVCVCVFVPPEISGRGGRIATLHIPSWTPSPGELHKLLFKRTRRAVREKKLLEVFRQLRPEFRAPIVTLLVTLARMNLATTTKRLEQSRRVWVEGNALHITGTIVAIAVYVYGLQILHSTRSWLLDKRPTRSWTGYN